MLEWRERRRDVYLNSHTGGDLHGGALEVIETCDVWFFRSTAWSSLRSSHIVKFVSRPVAAFASGRARWFLWSKNVGSEVVDLLFFFDFIDGRRRILVQDITRMSPGRRTTTTCAFLRATSLFIDSPSLIGDDTFLDLAMMEARRFFRHASRRRWWWVAAVFSGCRKF
jgi:hypothetical protein